MGEIVEFASNGTNGRGYLASPEGGGPGVIVIQEWWGLVPHITDICDRYAAAGFTALAPDLYRGDSTTEPDEAGKLMMALNIDAAARDMSGAIDYLLDRSSVVGAHVGVTGFCMGGGLCYVLGAHRPDVVAAIAPYYGVIPWPSAQPDYAKLECAVQGHYAMNDDMAPPDVARGLESRLRELGKECEIFIYDGTDHAFFNDERPDVFDEVAAQAAWDRTLAFLRAKLA